MAQAAIPFSGVIPMDPGTIFLFAIRHGSMSVTSCLALLTSGVSGPIAPTDTTVPGAIRMYSPRFAIIVKSLMAAIPMISTQPTRLFIGQRFGELIAMMSRSFGQMGRGPMYPAVLVRKTGSPYGTCSLIPIINGASEPDVAIIIAIGHIQFTLQLSAHIAIIPKISNVMISPVTQRPGSGVVYRVQNITPFNGAIRADHGMTWLAAHFMEPGSV